MKKFLENIIGIIIYAIIFFVFIFIAHPSLTYGQYIGYSLILGFFAGIINNLERALRELLENKNA